MASATSSTPLGGVDLGGTKIQAVVVTPGYDVLGQARRPTPTSGGPKAIVDAVVATMDDAAAAAGRDTDGLAGVGVGSPGAIDSAAGTVTEARNLPGWSGTYPLGKDLGERLGCRVVLGNDVHVANQAEYVLGAARGYASVLGVFWGTGVGGSLILDGNQWEGRGSAGEFGHMVVVAGGARCTCGRRGCVEAYAGRAAMEIEARRRHRKGDKTSLFSLMRQRNLTRLTSGIWFRAVADGDSVAKALVDRAIDALATGIASTVNLLDVEAVVVGGGLGVRFGTPAVARLEKAMRPHLFRDDRPPVVSVAALGDLGGAIGAALLVATPAATTRPSRPASRLRPAGAAASTKREPHRARLRPTAS